MMVSSASGTTAASARRGIYFVPVTMTAGRTPASEVPATTATVGAASVTHSGNGDGRFRQREALPNFIVLPTGLRSWAAFRLDGVLAANREFTLPEAAAVDSCRRAPVPGTSGASLLMGATILGSAPGPAGRDQITGVPGARPCRRGDLRTWMPDAYCGGSHDCNTRTGR